MACALHGLRAPWPVPAEVLAALAAEGTGTAFANWRPGAVASTIATHAARLYALPAV
ncbi:hypothetical protein [Streptomyces sp. NPDC059080]|uniref:hypothetical protein n=1 Tax=Streptomyces sp. NPDC059080 TaxID=3346718 RepID=UPI0036A08FC8